MALCTCRIVQQADNATQASAYVSSLSSPLHAFGVDPVFLPGNPLYNPWMAGKEGEVYNMTPGAAR